MHSIATFSAILAFMGATLTNALGIASVKNNCNFPTFLWSVSPSTVGPMQTLSKSGGSYHEAYQTTGGISLKLSLYNDTGSLYNGSALTQFQYNLDGTSNLVYYALANTNSAPFDNHSVVLEPTDSTCLATNWPTGEGPSSIHDCGAGANLTLTLC